MVDFFRFCIAYRLPSKNPTEFIVVPTKFNCKACFKGKKSQKSVGPTENVETQTYSYKNNRDSSLIPRGSVIFKLDVLFLFPFPISYFWKLKIFGRWMRWFVIKLEGSYHHQAGGVATVGWRSLKNHRFLIQGKKLKFATPNMIKGHFLCDFTVHRIPATLV